jgi:hypothetical protein
MKRPSPEVIKALAQMEHQYPVVGEWLREWSSDELSRLPNVTQSTALAQGRCQVLLELVKLIDESPELAGKAK